MKKFFVLLFVLIFCYSNANALCFIEDVECLAPNLLSGYSSDPDSVREWSSSSGKMFAFDDWIVAQVRFDQESLDILRSNSEFGLEIEAIISGPNRHQVQLRWTHTTFPSSANAGRDTEVCDYVTNYGEDSNVFAVHVLNASAIEKDTNYFVFFKLEDDLPSGGVEIKPGLQITVDANYGGLISNLIAESIPYLDQFQYYALETDHYVEFTAYPDQIKGVCWDTKSDSYNCSLVPDTSNPTEDMLQTSDGQGFTEISSDGDDVVDASGFGPGTSKTPTDQSDPDLPDFILDKLIITDTQATERYEFTQADRIQLHAYAKNIGDADWAGDADDIYVKFYLSNGYKEDSHSDWDCVGTGQIQKGNLDRGDTKHEEDALNLYYHDGAPLDPGVYNIVACVDRKYDQDNGDGEVPEKHKSNNCSTEAVFVVNNAPPAANFTANQTIGMLPLNVQFKDTSNWTPSSWNWNFGDGMSSNQRNPNHTYVSEGSYTVTLTTSNDYGQDKETKTNFITIAPKPTITITDPNSSDDWRCDDNGEYKRIKWRSEHLSSNTQVAIYYTYNGGSSWKTVTSSTRNDGSKKWYMCKSRTKDSKNSYVKIVSKSHPNIYDISQRFEIDHAKGCD